MWRTVCGEATQSCSWHSKYVLVLLAPGTCGLRRALPGAERSFLSSVASPLRNENKTVLLCAQPQFLQQDWLMEGCDFPAAIPPRHTEGFFVVAPLPLQAVIALRMG